MTERIEFIEVHPMRGHSRGEWYATVDDIVESEDDAEYWALFGVTHRGNKHCLGEFPTKKAALSAERGTGLLRADGLIDARGLAKTEPRKVVQIEVVSDPAEPTMIDLFALCGDGSVWRRGIGRRRGEGLMEDRWEPVSLDGIDDAKPASGPGSQPASILARPDDGRRK